MNTQSLKKYVVPFETGLDGFLFYALWIGFLSTLISLVFRTIPSLLDWSHGTALMYVAVQVGAVLLFGAQIVAFVDKKKYSWMLSLVQVVFVILFSMSTFGFVFKHLFAWLSGPYQSAYLILSAGCLAAAELGKTYYFYRTCKK